MQKKLEDLMRCVCVCLCVCVCVSVCCVRLGVCLIQRHQMIVSGK